MIVFGDVHVVPVKVGHRLVHIDVALDELAQIPLLAVAHAVFFVGLGRGVGRLGEQPGVVPGRIAVDQFHDLPCGDVRLGGAGSLAFLGNIGTQRVEKGVKRGVRSGNVSLNDTP
ncbi:MAG: hypothetical protein LBG57_10565 [Treponema sp.]|jgi:hypothetical protein|nr:hypothetical protein [Treponema sp.]